MAGQIVKRGDNIWLVRIFQGRDSNNKRRYLNKTVHGTKKDAGKFLTAKLREKDLGGDFSRRLKVHGLRPCSCLRSRPA